MKFAPRAAFPAEAPKASEQVSEAPKATDEAVHVIEQPKVFPAEITPPAPKNEVSVDDIEQKKFRKSAELIEKLEKSGNFMLASFLGLCKFFYADKKLLIVAESDYAHDLIKSHRVEIASAVSPLIGIPLAEGDVYVKLITGIIEDDPFADFLN